MDESEVKGGIIPLLVLDLLVCCSLSEHRNQTLMRFASLSLSIKQEQEGEERKSKPQRNDRPRLLNMALGFVYIACRNIPDHLAFLWRVSTSNKMATCSLDQFSQDEQNGTIQ